jgi:hypothetical protein
MSKHVELQMLRLIKAFQRVSDEDARRKILIYVEDLAEQNEPPAEKEPRHLLPK